MNRHSVTAGTAGTNGLFCVVGILIIMARKSAGCWGPDRRLLPLLGNPVGS